MAWKNPDTLKAIAQYIRLLTGLILCGLLIVMFANERIDLETVIKAMMTLLALDRFGLVITEGRGPTSND